MSDTNALSFEGAPERSGLLGESGGNVTALLAHFGQLYATPVAAALHLSLLVRNSEPTIVKWHSGIQQSHRALLLLPVGARSGDGISGMHFGAQCECQHPRMEGQ
jgi:hypothetical protein